MLSRLLLASCSLVAVGTLLATEPEPKLTPSRDFHGKLKIRMICGNPATDKRLELLANSPQVESLEIYGDKTFTDDGLIHLSKLPKLEILFLGSPAITDRGLAVIHGNKTIRELGLGEFTITEKIAAHIASIPNLEVLKFHGEAIEPAAWVHLKSIKNLREIELRSDKITDADLEALKAFPKLAKIRIVGDTFTDAGLAHLAKKESITKLALQSFSLSEAGAKALATLPRLKDLTIAYAQMDPSSIAEIAKLPSLHTLSIHGGNLKDADYHLLANSETLRVLHLQTAQLSEAGCHALRAKLPNTVVNRYGWAHTVADLKAMTASMKLNDAGQPTEVTMKCGRWATDAKLVELRGFKTIETLVLLDSESDLTDEGIRELKHLPSLKSVRIYSELVTDASLKTLEGLKLLRIVKIDSDKITEAGLAALRKARPDMIVNGKAASK